MSRARRFQPFSYGFEGNIRRYGSPQPPRYADSFRQLLTQFHINVCAGTRDTLIPTENLEEMASCIPSSTLTGSSGWLEFKAL